MPTSNIEQLILDELDLNDEKAFVTESLNFVPASPKPQFVGNADADGEELVREPNYTNAYFEFQIRVLQTETTDLALEAIGEILDKLQKCARTQGGVAFEWIPNNTETPYTWYAIHGELTEVPVTPTGELAGWFLKSPVIKVKLTCRPFGYTEERAVLSAKEAGESTQVVYVGEIKGDVPAEGRLVLTDKSSQNRRYAEWGQDVVTSEVGNPDLLLETGVDISARGFAGTEYSGISGSVSTKVIGAYLGATAVALCSTGSIKHIGSYRLKLRCQILTEGAKVRASYRVGDGPLTVLNWRQPELEDEWIEVDLGEIFLEEAERGAQVSEIRLECKNDTGSSVFIYLDTLTLVPTRRYGVAHAPIDLSTPSSLIIADSFSQSEGVATGKEADVGGTYAAITNSDTTDFTVAGGKLKRTAVSDSGTMGSLPFHGRAIGTSRTLEDFAIKTDFRIESETLYNLRFGHMISYVNNTNFVIIYLTKSIYYDGWFARCIRANGSGPSIGGSLTIVPGISGTSPVEGTMVSVVEGNKVTLYTGINDENLKRHGSAEDAMIGVSGKVAVFDENLGSGAATREYDNLAVWTPETTSVCPSSQSLEFRSDSVERENSGGTYWSPVPEYRGANFLLDPAGTDNNINRLTAKMRRNDTSTEADTNLTDKQIIEVCAKERYLMPR